MKWVAALCSAFVVAGLITLAVASLSARDRLNSWLTIEQIQARIAADIRPGSILRDVDLYLHQNHVEHSYDTERRRMYAAVRNIRGGWLLISDKDALMTFTFSREGLVETVDVRPAFNGL